VAAERRVLASLRTEETARLALLPSFTLNLEGGHLSDGVTSLLHLNPWIFRAALGVYVPVYQGGALTAQIRIATAQQQQALAGYGSAVLAAFQEVENTLANELVLADRVRFEEAEVRSRQQAARIAGVQYKAGATDLLSVLQLQNDALGSEANLIKLRNARLANRIDLHLALGGSFEAAAALAPLALAPAAISIVPSPTFERGSEA
jgi:outer membrane protein, multidrug efflux system